MADRSNLIRPDSSQTLTIEEVDSTQNQVMKNSHL